MDTNTQNTTASRLIWLLLGVGLVIRIGLAIYMQISHPGNFMSGDTLKFMHFADVIFSAPLDVYDDRLRPNIGPLYPALLHFMQMAFGDHSVFAVVVLQCILLTACVYMIFRIGKALFGARTGLLAALFLSLDYTVLEFSLTALTETLYTFLLYGALLFGVKLALARENKDAYKYALAFSLILGISALCRSLSYYMMVPVIIFFPLCALFILKWPLRKVVLVSMMVLAPWMALTQGWQNIVYAKTHADRFSTSGTYQLFTRRAADTLATAKGISFQDAKAEMVEQVPTFFTGPGHVKYDQMDEVSHAVIKQYPWIHTKRTLLGTFRLLMIPGEAEFVRGVFNVEAPRQGPMGDLQRLNFDDYIEKWSALEYAPYFIFFAFSLGALLVFYAAGATGALASMTSGNTQSLTAHLFLIGIIIYLVLVSSGVESHARYRMPIMPLIYLYAAYGFGYIGKKIRKNT